MYTTLEKAVLDLQEGNIDYIWSNLDPEQVENLRENSYITIEKSDELGYYYLAPNINRHPFNSRILRQALVYLIDKPYIVENVLKGYGGVAHSVVMPSAGEWYNPHVNKFGDSLSQNERRAKATEMLRDVGYTIPDIGYPEGVLKLPNGEDMQPFEILTTLSDYDPVRAECGLLIQNWWREIGIPATVRHVSFDEINSKTFETMDFDWFILGWNLSGTSYPDHMRYLFHSDQSFPEGENPMNYWNAEVDRLLEDLVSLCDHDELVAAAWRAQEIIVEDVAYCPLYYRTLNEAHRNDTFTGWFTQLGGVAGSETPRHCLIYLQPVNQQGKGGQSCLGSLLLVVFGGVALCWRMH